MNESSCAHSPGPADTRGCLLIEVVAALHLIALRRQFRAIRIVFGSTPLHRSREAIWAMLEVTLSHLRGEQIGLRDLVTRAAGILSAPTLWRVVTDLEQAGLLRAERPSDHRRAKLLHPTPRLLAILSAQAPAAFAEFADTFGEAERRLSEAADLPDMPEIRSGVADRRALKKLHQAVQSTYLRIDATLEALADLNRILEECVENSPHDQQEGQ